MDHRRPKVAVVEGLIYRLAIRRLEKKETMQRRVPSREELAEFMKAMSEVAMARLTSSAPMP
jgi:hypothetical protein